MLVINILNKQGQSLIYILAFLFCTISSQAQLKLIDSLKVQLKTLEKSGDFERDTNYINTLNELSHKYSRIDLDTCYQVAERTLLLSEKNNYLKGTIGALRNIGIVYVVKGDNAKALQYFNDALKKAESVNLKSEIGKLYNNIALVYHNQTNRPKALEYYFKSLTIREEIRDLQGVGACLNNIAVIYHNQKKYNESLEYHRKSLKIKDQLGDKHGKAFSLQGIANVYYETNKLDEGLDYSNQALSIRREIGDIQGIAASLHAISTGLLLKGENRKALEGFIEALEVFKKTNEKRGMIESLIGISGAYSGLNQLDSSIHYAIKSQELSRQLNFKRGIVDSNQQLSKLYEQKGDLAKALFFYKEFKTYSDSINNSEVEKKITNLEMQYDFEKKENEMRAEQAFKEIEHKQQVSQQRLIIFSILLILISVLVLTYLQFKSRNKLAKAYSEIQKQKEHISFVNTQLEERNNNLSQLNAEKNNLIQIVAHDLKTPIGHITGFATILKEELIDANVDQVRFLDTIIRSSKRLNEMIKKILDIEAIESGNYHIKYEVFDVRVVVEQVISMFKIAASKKSIHIILDDQLTNNGNINVDKSYFYQVIENLISNALKFSFEGREIFVILKNTNNYIRISVKDQGPGLSEEDKTKLFKKFQRLSAQPIGGEKSTGLGLTIVKRFTEMMHGKIWCESTQGFGAEFIVEFAKADLYTDKQFVQLSVLNKTKAV